LFFAVFICLCYYIACETSIDLSLNFGGTSWQISNADFQLKQMGNGQCLGAFFALTTGDGAPNWIIGDTFLVSFFDCQFQTQLKNLDF
jgi:cathepsin D